VSTYDDAIELAAQAQARADAAMQRVRAQDLIVNNATNRRVLDMVIETYQDGRLIDRTEIE
jgi:hypothetical protein